VPGRQTERFLTAILFTDVVGSTEVAAELGDRGWHDLVQEHHRLLRSAVRKHGGKEVDSAGDGFFVIFDAPAAAAECALEAVEAVQSLGIQIRAGLHVGEVQHIGAMVDRAVTDLGLWCPLINEGSQFVSKRFGNYQYNVAYSLLLDQPWVQ
jgi:class 3 adenylate cyclase